VRALITGGAGFIGSHLAEELLRRGHWVTVIDDLSTGSIENIRHLKQDARFRYVIDSIFNPAVLAELVDSVEAVFHLAAAVGVRLIVECPIRTIETNVKGTELVLEMAAKKKRPVLIASTSEVYGKSNKERFGESDDLVLGPTSKSRWSYAASKAIDEFLALAYWHEKRLPVIITRLFNTVGPRQTGRYGMVVPRFIQQALQGRPLTVYGSGEQTRSFTWVGDVVGALIALMEHSHAVGEIFNVGHREPTTILDLAKLTKRLTQSDSPIKLVPYEEAYGAGFEDMLHRVPDITKLERLIGYKPSKTLSEILESIIADQRIRSESGWSC
jgi:UDP-glucose 4-epimerase